LKNSVMYLVIFLFLFELSPLVSSNHRNYSLLQYLYGESGYHYSSSYTDTYEYTDSVSGMLLPSVFQRYITINSDGDITHENESYGIAYNTTYPDSSLQLDFTCTNLATNSILYQKTVVYDCENRLTYYAYDSSWYDLKMRRFVNQVTSLTDSLIFEIGPIPPYRKFIYSYDNLNRVTARYMYTSADSINWTYAYYSDFEYGAQLPMSISLFYQETISYETIYTFPETQFQILSQTEHDLINNTTYTVPYYLYSQSPLTFYFGNGAPPDIYEFADSGRLAWYWYSPDGTYGNGSRYNWGEYTSVDDDIINPSEMKVYPNPFAGMLNINLNSELKSPVDISIYNIRGQLVRGYKNVADSKMIWDGKDNNQNPVRSGIYIIRVTQAKQISTFKAVKLQI
jgi:hypothetical protein